MKKNKFILKNFGFSLVELTVAMGLLGALSVGVMKLMENSNKAAKTIESKDEILQITNQINDILRNPNNCEATLGSKTENNSVSFINQVIQGTSVPKFTASTTPSPKVSIESMRLKDIDDNGSNGSSAIGILEVTFKKPGAALGGQTIKKEISLSANLCRKDYLENTDSSSLLTTCSGPNKLLLSGPNPYNGKFWAICQDCTNAISNNTINSCQSQGGSGGVDVADMHNMVCVQFGTTYDADVPGCIFPNGQTLTQTLSTLYTSLAELQSSLVAANTEINNIKTAMAGYPGSLLSNSTVTCVTGSTYALTLNSAGKIELTCAAPVACTGCSSWTAWNIYDKGDTCVYSCSWSIKQGTRTTCRYSRSCNTKTPAGCTGSIGNQFTGFYNYLEGVGGDKYYNTSSGRTNARQAACPGASTFGIY